MRISTGQVELEVDDQGPPTAPAVVMIMGLGMPLTAWPEELVALLLARGLRVVRFDNRDIGLSQYFDHLGVPNLGWTFMRYAMHLPVHAPYELRDMAADVLGLMDALGLPRAHVCSASMGGMIAQHLAAEQPERVRSLTLMMTTSGARDLPHPSLALRRALLRRPDPGDPQQVVAYLVWLYGLIGSPAYPPDPQRLRTRLEAMVRRAWHPAGTARQLTAVVADGDRTPLLERITAPTHVIHGEDDPLVPPAAGHDLARRIAGASADFIPGMGHDLPLPLLERFADGIARNAARGS